LRISGERFHITSPALRITIGTIGTRACNAMWAGVLLEAAEPRRRAGVPSGAVAIDSPWRSFSTAGASAARAWGVLPRSA
jgi:hypothetical protein